MLKRWSTFEIVDRSMAPTLLEGDWVVGVDRTPVSGDVVVFDAPTGMVMVKRIVATEAQSVIVSKGGIRVDGTVLPRVLDVIGDGAWKVPAGHLFVLSDAADVTMSDSRTFGPVPLASVRAVVALRYWPLSRFGRVLPRNTG